jgi:16S rRNA (uracil1498-N3)-methyltransferase
MGKPRFFILSTQLQQDYAVLTGREFHHLRHVLRLNRGDHLILCDETGREHQGTITTLSSTRAEITLTSSSVSVAPPFVLTLAQGLLKGQKMDWVIEKATELGVHRIVPFFSSFTVAHLPAERQEERLARWQRIAQSAAKQSGNPPPFIAAPHSFQELLAIVPQEAGRILLYEKEKTVILKSIVRSHSVFPALWIIVGPEGGFAAEEVADARAAGFHIVGLGTRTLRAETASIVAVTLCQFLWGDTLPPLPFGL